MRSRLVLVALVITTVLGVLAVTSCKEKEKPSGKIKIVSTIGMINDIAQNIGKTHVEAISLMGAGVDPHLYKASEGDTRRLANADLILYNGLHLEALHHK